MMNALNMINVLYVNPTETLRMQKTADKYLRKRFESNFLGALRAKNAINKFFMVVALVLMIFFVGKAQTNLINWIFWTLNVLNFAFLAVADNATSTNKASLRVARAIKVFSAYMLLFDILFMSFVGEAEQPDMPQSTD